MVTFRKERDMITETEDKVVWEIAKMVLSPFNRKINEKTVVY